MDTDSKTSLGEPSLVVAAVRIKLFTARIHAFFHVLSTEVITNIAGVVVGIENRTPNVDTVI